MNQHAPVDAAALSRPLVLDVDGTLLRTDMLFENLWTGLGRDAWGTVRAVLPRLHDPAALKHALAWQAAPRTEMMPVNAEVLALATAAQATGREVILASASNDVLVEDLARTHGLTGAHLSSDAAVNLKGAAKAAALVERYGAGGFDYAGDSKADRVVWEAAATCILVGRPHEEAEELRAEGHEVIEIAAPSQRAALIRALRPHQWVKNVLLLLPLIAAHAFALAPVLQVLLGIAAFSAAASCIYIVNDLLDLDADRRHATKRRRPFAAGTLSIPVGMASCFALGGFALGTGLVLGGAFALTLAVYMALSLAYSLRLKRMRWVDVAVLATLYTLRVVAGAAAGGIPATITMLVFAWPVFLSLGCVKRMTELAKAKTDARLPGRGYARADMGDLHTVAWLGAAGALVIYFLYGFSAQAVALYPDRWLLWAALVPLALWLHRMIRLGAAGRMDYDPIVFAMRDRIGLALVMLTITVMFWAAGLWGQWFGVA
ncbi:MAG: UbiA family prenyltransferase [Hasllibacter sp.]